MPSGVILTGGRATRFGGRDKGQLVVDGRSILDRLIDVLSNVTDDILIIGRPPSIVPHPAQSTGATVRIATDRTPDCGPLGGLDTALAEARYPEVLLLACDMPFVTTDLLAFLARLTSEADAVVPRTARGFHPLCAAYKQTCRPVVARRLTAGHLALAGLLDEVRVRAVDVNELQTFGDPETLLANINTPADYDDAGAPERHKV
jgi:molybdopterin-guanine dinucleotide biosynthesis protein A